MSIQKQNLVLCTYVAGRSEVIQFEPQCYTSMQKQISLEELPIYPQSFQSDLRSAIEASPSLFDVEEQWGREAALKRNLFVEGTTLEATPRDR